MLEKFKSSFLPLYGEQDQRWPGFLFIAEQLIALNRPVIIVETGTMREPGNYQGDGSATQIWNWLAQETGGVAITIDLDPHATALAQKYCGHTVALTRDSITALRNFLPQPIDLMFHDSFDYQPGQEVNSMFHMVAELGSIWPRLPKDCLIAVDDCHSAAQGKHALIRRCLAGLNIQPLQEGYITVWKKP